MDGGVEKLPAPRFELFVTSSLPLANSVSLSWTKRFLTTHPQWNLARKFGSTSIHIDPVMVSKLQCEHEIIINKEQLR